jgi:hypothetical protein
MGWEGRPAVAHADFGGEKYFFTYIHLHSLGSTWIDLTDLDWRDGNSGLLGRQNSFRHKRAHRGWNVHFL